MADDSLTECRYTGPGRPRRRLADRMIHSLTVDGYRGFSHFEMGGLGRVNLLVGTNNSGKTSVLEALYLLAAGGDASAFWRIVARRGERLNLEPPPREPELEFDISHLFHNHDLKVGATFSVVAKNQTPPRSVKVTIGERKKAEGAKSADDGLPPPIFLLAQTAQRPNIIPLTRRGGLRSEALETPRRGQRNIGEFQGAPVQYISTESLSIDELSSMWNQIALTEAEQRVVRAIRFLEPKVDRIAPITTSYFYSYPAGRGGFIVKLSDVEQPIPIGSLGDGTWRMLALAIALSRAKDGVLLVDEIDTGLHYTVMSDMWKLISETAKLLNVQVFATTHSFDCVHSLAAICHPDVDKNSEVTLQRIETNNKKAIPFSESEIRIAAERQIEVR